MIDLIGVEAVGHEADLRAVSVRQHDLIAVFNKLNDLLARISDGDHLLRKAFAQSIAAKGNDDSLIHV
jgi:hypothetical protein